MHFHDFGSVADVGPGPPPRVRVASGLPQPAESETAISSMSAARFISHPLSGKDDDQTKKKTADQNKDGSGRHVPLAEPAAANKAPAAATFRE